MGGERDSGGSWVYAWNCEMDFVFLLVFFFFVSFSLAVFYQASAFNQDVSKWNTGAVTTMQESKCTLSPSLCGHAFHCCVFWIYDNSSFIGSQFSHVLLYLFLCFRNGTFCCCLWWVGVFLFFVAPSLFCSVSVRNCVQSGRVQMEYGKGDKYGL